MKTVLKTGYALARNIVFIFILIVSSVQAQQVLSEKDQAKVVESIQRERLTRLLPSLMDKHGIDMWIIISREYNEDPVIKTFLPPTWLNARRRTILMFFRDREKDTMEALSVARYRMNELIPGAWDKEQEPDQWKRLVQLIQDRNPGNIALNYSEHFNISDGLVKTDYEEFMEVLPTTLRGRIVSAEPLAVSWIETRTDLEMEIYPQLVTITHQIIAEAFSEKVITPGITTTTQVEWWMRQKVTDLGLDTWFHPTVDIQRTSEALQGHLYAFSDRPDNQVIMAGDLLHCDFGITYLGLNTDCQQLAYVLKPTELEAPEFLQDALKEGNRLQDILTKNFQKGRTGNEILATARKEAIAGGLRPAIYTHPLGSFGHSAGTTIGMWDAQEGVPGDGDHPMEEGTVYAIELNTTVYLEAWKRDIRVMLEEAGYFGPEGFRYVNGRQNSLLLIPRKDRNHLGLHQP